MIAKFLKRLLHGIVWIGFAGQNGEANQLVKSSWQRRIADPIHVIKLPAGTKPADRHAVQRQRAGLVDAQNGG